jgi:hypothetical protein
MILLDIDESSFCDYRSFISHAADENDNSDKQDSLIDLLSNAKAKKREV